MERKKTYIAIDLKSFYASSECIERNLDPLTTNLVVADLSRTEKTICLAVSPCLKEYGISGRPRLFEVIQKVKEINDLRRKNAPGGKLIGKSIYGPELKQNPSLELDYVVATPQMSHYINVSSKIYSIYLKYISSEDIHVYSIDEVFMDVTNYLSLYKMSAKELAMTMIKDVLKETGITATAGVATNLFLAKAAMDIVAKHIKPDENGVRIAELDEHKYRELLWDVQPLTSFWRVGKGYQRRLEMLGCYTMGDVARLSIKNEDLLYETFGVNAELLINHAWGYEPTTIKDIKNYKSDNHSLGSGQVLSCPYDYEKTKLVVLEMIDSLCLDLVSKKLLTSGITLNLMYAVDNNYKGETKANYYGKLAPKPAHGSIGLYYWTSSNKMITEATMRLFDRIMDKRLSVSKIAIAVSIIPEDEARDTSYEQLSLFEDSEELDRKKTQFNEELKEERKLQETILSIQNKYGKNSLIKGADLTDGAKTLERNSQIGGHKA